CAWCAIPGRNFRSAISISATEKLMKRKNKAAKNAPRAVMSKSSKVALHRLPTGVRGLDDILGGGIPEFSFNMIGGAPGCGKTTLAHQIAFANGTPEKPAL